MINKLMIGGHEYKVDYVDGLKGDEGEALYGQIIFGYFSVKIDNDQGETYKLITLLHEALHGILQQVGLDNSEPLVVALSHGLYLLLRDNPELVAAIQRNSLTPEMRLLIHA